MSSCLGQLLSRKTKLDHVRDLYSRSGSNALHFCELFLGDRSSAERATVESFDRSFKDSGHVAMEGIPVALLSVAFRVVCQSPTSLGQELDPLRAAILRLEPTERAVFILHSVMSVQMPSLAAIVGVRPEKASELWAKSLVEVRELLPREFFKERSK
jgi:DNA-directed RNA polymerase specialized sigma24 family protein